MFNSIKIHVHSVFEDIIGTYWCLLVFDHILLYIHSLLFDFLQESGLSKAIGSFLIGFQSLPPALVVLIMVIVGTVFTTFTSNVSTTTILLPITSQLVTFI